MNEINSTRLHPETHMPLATTARLASRPNDSLLTADTDRFAATRFGNVSDEVVVVDDRSGLSPSQAVEKRLVALLRESSVPVSHLQVRGFVRGRQD